MYKLIALYLLAIVGIFIEPDFLGSVGNVLLKLLILGGISYLIYDVWNDKGESEAAQDEKDISAIEDVQDPLIESFFEKITTRLDHFYKQDQLFNDFLSSQFKICRQYSAATNGYLIYKHIANSGSLLLSEAPYATNANKANSFLGLISLVDKSKGVLIENQLSDANSLFSFYDKETYQPNSLLAFKTSIDAQQSLYWFFDASEKDFFNSQDRTVYERFSRNTAFGTIRALENQELKIIHSNHTRALHFAKQLNNAQNTEESLDMLSDHLVEFFEASKLTIALRTDNEKAIICKSIGVDDPFKQGEEFSINEGLNGWVILKNKPYLIDNIDKGEYFIPRFNRSEKTNYSLRSFLSVPIPGEVEALGMITLEDKTENKFTEEDKQNLMTCAEIFSAGLRRFSDIKKEQLEEQ